MSSATRSREAREDFEKLTAAQGYTILEPYVRAKEKLLLRCPALHEFRVSPSGFKQGYRCARCSRAVTSDQYKAVFFEAVARIGGKVIGSYVDTSTRVACICPRGHLCMPYPSGVTSRGGMCGKCRGQTREKFFQKAKEQGVIVKGEYIKGSKSIECVCPEGHTCYPSPNSVILNGGDFCSTCRALDASKTRQAGIDFEAEVKSRGYTMLEPYTYNRAQTKLRCAEGHEFSVSPEFFKSGGGNCRECFREQSEARLGFFKRISDFGGKVVGQWVNVNTKVECVCAKGHICILWPNSMFAGRGMCRTCNSDPCKEFFYDKAKEARVTLLGEYISSDVPVDGICPNGHHFSRKPTYIQQGNHFCICIQSDGMLPGEKFLAFMEKMGHIVIGIYVDSRTKVETRCPQNHVCHIRPGCTETQGLCRRCRTRSQGEDKVNDALQSLNVTFNREFRLPSERRRYDFELPDYKIIIETDGQQHFQLDSRFTRTDEQLKLSHLKDVVKMLEVKRVDYKIIRIDYTWYKKPVEDFIAYLKPILENPDELPWFTCTTPDLYDWVYELIPSEFSEDEEPELVVADE